MGNTTILNSIKINSFRGIKNLDIKLSSRINIICGKNGTSKSTILGAIAQAFAFNKDHYTNTDLDFKTLSGKNFTSAFSEHFRISETHDKPHSMDITLSVYDAYINKNLDNLALDLVDITDRKARVVLRNNSPTSFSTNTSRKVTHPIIYLSLKRFFPISERKYDPTALEYIQKHSSDFLALSNKILCKPNGKNLTSTQGTINSTVVHGDSYDHESVSAGEDNIGQIISALFSFKKLKEDYENYHGGILLIDEADAGLFPAAQKEFIQVLSSSAKKYNLQIIMTSHSPILIEEVKKLSENSPHEYKTFYLTDSYGEITLIENLSWKQILADLFTETIALNKSDFIPKINVYFEDTEAFDFFNALTPDRKYNKIFNKLSEISLGCSQYLTLVKKNVDEFSTRSLIILDGDVKNVDKYKSIVKLPHTLPPDQLVFIFLFHLNANDDFWQNEFAYTKAVFWKNSIDICNRLKISTSDTIEDLASLIKADQINGNSKIREDFKKFYKNEEFQLLFKKVKTNPFRYFLEKNPDLKNEFINSLHNSVKYIYEIGHHVPTSKIEAIFQ